MNCCYEHSKIATWKCTKKLFSINYNNVIKCIIKISYSSSRIFEYRELNTPAWATKFRWIESVLYSCCISIVSHYMYYNMYNIQTTRLRRSMIFLLSNYMYITFINFNITLNLKRKYINKFKNTNFIEYHFEICSPILWSQYY